MLMVCGVQNVTVREYRGYVHIHTCSCLVVTCIPKNEDLLRPKYSDMHGPPAIHLEFCGIAITILHEHRKFAI